MYVHNIVLWVKKLYLSYKNNKEKPIENLIAILHTLALSSSQNYQLNSKLFTALDLLAYYKNVF